MKMNKETTFKGNPDYITQAEALNETQMNQLTFLRRAQRMGVTGTREGRCTYYLRADIEKIKYLADNQVRLAINLIERETGKRVVLQDR